MIEHQRGAEPYHHDVLHAEQDAIDRAEHHSQLLDTDACVEGVDGQILIEQAAVSLPVEKLHALHAPNGFQKVALLFGRAHDLVFRDFPERPISCRSQHGVQRGRAAHDERQLHAVDEHHHRRRRRHHAVHHDIEERCGHRAPNGIERAEAGYDVTHVAAGEKRQGELDEVCEEAGQQVQVQSRIQVQTRPRSQDRDTDLNQSQEHESEGQHRQHIPVSRNDGVVDDQLHEQGTDDREHFENRAQQEELGQDPAKSRHPSHELSDAHLTPLRLGLKPVVRCELQGHTREVGRKLSHADSPATESGVEDDRRLPLDRDEHNEMTQIPVEDRGKAQSIHRLQLTA